MGFFQDGPYRSAATNGDLSTKQYQPVQLNSSGTLDVAADNSFPIGVLIDDPKSGKTGTYQVRDVTKVKVGAAVTVGDYLEVASGKAVTATTGHKSFGRALQSASGANSIIACELRNTIAP